MNNTGLFRITRELFFVEVNLTLLRVPVMVSCSLLSVSILKLSNSPSFFLGLLVKFCDSCRGRFSLS
jgi:hypothetical protein